MYDDEDYGMDSEWICKRCGNDLSFDEINENGMICDSCHEQFRKQSEGED